MLTADEEMSRYDQHNNSISDLTYRSYLQTLIKPLSELLTQRAPGNHLDFGSGKAPVVSELFKEQGWQSEYYDCYFYPSLPKKQFDVVTCIEVVEHFRDALPNWQELVDLVKTNGLILVNTQVYHPELKHDEDERKFERWWYKNDPTHVGIYCDKTLALLEVKFGLERLYFDNIKTIIWRKRS